MARIERPVPTVRLIIPDDKGRVLIVKRKSTGHGLGAWCLPGGKIDYGETVRHAIEEELREETSLEFSSFRFLFLQDSLPYSPGGMHCINLYFECVVSGDVVLNEESSEFAWIGPAEMGNYDITFRNDLALKSYWNDSIGQHQRPGLLRLNDDNIEKFPEDRR